VKNTTIPLFLKSEPKREFPCYINKQADTATSTECQSTQGDVEIMHNWVHEHCQCSVTWLLKSTSKILHAYVVHTRYVHQATLKLVIKSDMHVYTTRGAVKFARKMFKVMTRGNSMSSFISHRCIYREYKNKIPNKYVIIENSSSYITSLWIHRKYKIWDIVSL